jgi:hypothetical protein
LNFIAFDARIAGRMEHAIGLAGGIVLFLLGMQIRRLWIEQRWLISDWLIVSALLGLWMALFRTWLSVQAAM